MPGGIHIRPRALAALACATVLALAIAAGMPATGSSATSGTVVSATIPSATSVIASGCAPSVAGRTDFGVVIPGTPVVTTDDCTVAFGSSNDTSQLQVRQSDLRDHAMWSPTRGALDASFDGPGTPGNGAFRVGIGSGDDEAAVTTVLPDGRILVAGDCDGASSVDFCLMRFLPDGSWDTSFDGPSGSGDGRFIVQVTTSADRIFALEVLPDGRFVVGGMCREDAAATFCFARFNADGSYDTTFDGPSGTGNGRFEVSVLGAYDHSYALDVLDDGRLVAAGDCHSGGIYDACFIRLDETGALDPTFDGPGTPGNGTFKVDMGGMDSSITALHAAPDGSVTAAGFCDSKACFARFTATGAWDTTFDGPGGSGNGWFEIPSIDDDDEGELTRMHVLEDGGILALRPCVDGSYLTWCMMRMTSTGAWDTTFDGPSGTGNGTFNLDVGSGDDYAADLAVQPDGGIVIVGECDPSGAALPDGCAARLTTTGAWDVDFDGPAGTGNGRFLYSQYSGEDGLEALALDSDGRVVAAGECDATTDDLCMLRFDAGGTIDDYVTGGGSDRDWSSGTSTSLFGACLRDVSGGATATWASTTTCPQTDGAQWNAVPTSWTQIARTTAAEPDPADASAHLRFGFRPASAQARGRYIAPIEFQVLAPG